MSPVDSRAAYCRYDPDPSDTVIEEDKDLLESYLLVPEQDFKPELQSPWLLRIELDKVMMLDKHLECLEVADRISTAYLGLVHVINSEDNAEKLVLRLRLVEGTVLRLAAYLVSMPSLVIPWTSHFSELDIL
jgi:DNA-directed RNA polymerase II subunit RPB1